MNFVYLQNCCSKFLVLVVLLLFCYDKLKYKFRKNPSFIIAFFIASSEVFAAV